MAQSREAFAGSRHGGAPLAAVAQAAQQVGPESSEKIIGPASQLLDLVRKSGIAPSCCCFEFRREAEARDTRSLAIAASELRAAGLHVALRNGRALDLEALLSLRPSIVRLTPDIVQGANPAELDCARRTVAVLRCIGAEPLMEGVEEAQAMEIARELGVRYGQPSYAWCSTRHPSTGSRSRSAARKSP